MMRIQKFTAGLGLIAAVSIILSGCGYPGGSSKCAEGFTDAALAVDGVAAAEFECGGSFGNPYERGSITLDATEQDEATPIIEDVYRAFAGDTSINGADTPVIEFVGADSRPFDNLAQDFGGTPAVWEMRDRYCGDMECESGVTK